VVCGGQVQWSDELMQLRCAVCHEAQPVNVPDIDDEDPRTQGIRRSFREDHLGRCGGAVALELHAVESTQIDLLCWSEYLGDVKPPSDVAIQADGYFTRIIVRDGVAHAVRACEDCWQNIPRYVDFPDGLVSPESDGHGSAKAKKQPTTVSTESPLRAPAEQHMPRAVCLPCYLAAFARVYPDATTPTFSDAVVG
jgi:hypothetical protein